MILGVTLGGRWGYRGDMGMLQRDTRGHKRHMDNTGRIEVPWVTRGDTKGFCVIGGGTEAT